MNSSLQKKIFEAADNISLIAASVTLQTFKDIKPDHEEEKAINNFKQKHAPCGPVGPPTLKAFSYECK